MNRPQSVLSPCHKVPWWLEKVMVATVGKSRLQAPKLMFYQAMWQDPGPESAPQPFLWGNRGGVRGVRKVGKNYTELLRGNLSNSHT